MTPEIFPQTQQAQCHPVRLTISKTASYNAPSDLVLASYACIVHIGTKGLSWAGPIAQNFPTVGLLLGCRRS
jgi:hypothetical protein